MRPSIRHSAVAGLVLVALLLTACTSGAETEQGGGDGSAQSKGLPSEGDVGENRQLLLDAMDGAWVAYVPLLAANPLNATWQHAMETSVEQLGGKFTVDDGGNNIDTLIQSLNSRINDGVDVLVIQNPDVGVFSEQIRQAQSQGTYVVSLLTPSTTPADVHIGPDNQAMAAAIAHRMVEDCKPKNRTKVAIINGFGTDAMSISSNRGWKPVFEEAGFEVVSEQNSDFDPTKANQIASTVLQQNRDLCGFAVVFDQTALGASEAVSLAGLQGGVGVYATDASAPTCEALLDGRMTATAAFSADAMGVAAAAAIQRLLLVHAEAGSQRSISYVPFTVADATNIGSVPGACY
jgi:ribose transport system substrate-binding protein